MKNNLLFKSNLLFEVLLAGAFFFLGGFVLASTACADDRIDRISLAWNAGDQAGTQQSFDRTKPREMAELASKVQGSLDIAKTIRLNDHALATKSVINGEPYVWIFAECEQDKQKFCGFWMRKVVSGLGGAEYGQAADVFSTLAGLSVGGAELNPMGALVIPYKMFWLAYSRSDSIDFDGCVGLRSAHEEVGYGAGAANAAGLLGAPFGVGLAIGIGVAIAMHPEATERAVWECAAYRLEA